MIGTIDLSIYIQTNTNTHLPSIHVYNMDIIFLITELTQMAKDVQSIKPTIKVRNEFSQHSLPKSPDAIANALQLPMDVSVQLKLPSLDINSLLDYIHQTPSPQLSTQQTNVPSTSNLMNRAALMGKFECPLCNLRYRSQAFLNEHMRKEHSILI